MFHTLHPEIFMPLRDGTLTSLAQSSRLPFDHNTLSLIVLKQILCALDYLSNENLIHRDVKPDNILYFKLGVGSVDPIAIRNTAAQVLKQRTILRGYYIATPSVEILFPMAALAFTLLSIKDLGLAFSSIRGCSLG